MIPAHRASVSFFALLSLALAPPASAAGVTVNLTGSFVDSVTSNGTTIDFLDLRPGVSSGATAAGYSIEAADGRNLAFYFARTGGAETWEVSFGSWRNSNGAGPDFFVFEVGGNDSLVVAPRFLDGTLGQERTIGGWTSTGYQVPAGPNNDQTVYGLAFRHSDLLDASGAPLAPSTRVASIRVRSSTIDGAAFLAHDPGWAGSTDDGDRSAAVHGRRSVWHPLEVWFRGPWAVETGSAPNPFLDRRLDVTFDGPGGASYTVPGFFDGDGFGSGVGTVWKARFTPDRAGTWRATASFRNGAGVAVSSSPTAGTPGLLDGVSVAFTVEPRDAAAPGFLSWGRLEYRSGHYRKFANGPWFVKTGTNSPENFLAYRGFHHTSKTGGIGVLHDFAPHAADWVDGDPYFEGNVYSADSKGIIGALNYLSSVGVNSVFTMLMNLGGDGWDVHPFIGTERDGYDKTHFDVKRLHQWNVVFEHAARKGIALHFGLAETEPTNENWLDNGQLGTERRLFLREMVARFAHLHAIKWTLSEENDFSVSLLRQMADTIRQLDAYGHEVTFHNHPNDFADYDQVYGEARFSATSMQYEPDQAGFQVERMRERSAAAGHPWAVHMDENNPWNVGLTNSNATDLRKRVLYDVLLSGGQIEWYAGWHNLPLGGDLTLEDFRTREGMWQACNNARRFLQHIPFHRMEPADDLLTGESGSYGGGEVLRLASEVYAVYLPSASNGGTLSLAGASGPFQQRWFDPRTGSFAGSVRQHSGASAVLGAAPYSPGEDWLVLVEREGDLLPDVSEISISAGGTQNLSLEPGPASAGRTYLVLGSLGGTQPGFPLGSVHVPLRSDRYTVFTVTRANTPMLHRTRGVIDASGRGQAAIRIFPNALPPSLAGVTMTHAFVLISPVDYVSVPVELSLRP